MQLEHSFTVPAPIERAWAVLLDLERVAPCMPGAALDSFDGDEFAGSVKVKLGPINLTYKGTGRFVEKDAGAHRAIIDARGKDARGSGTANAKITTTLTDRGDQTYVEVLTDLDITGKPAQFGRGVMVDVGNRLIGQFASCLADELKGAPRAAAEAEPAPGGIPESVFAPAHAATPAEAEELEVAALPHIAPAHTGSEANVPSPEVSPRTPGPRREVEPIDLLQQAGPAVLKRALPPLLLLLIVITMLRRLRRH